MNDKNRDRFIDELLDASLARYSQVEPRQGLEKRLLVQVQSAKATRPGRILWRWYFVPAMAAAGVLLAIANYLLRNPGVQSPVSPAAVVAVNSGSAPAMSAPGIPVGTRDLPSTHPTPARAGKSPGKTLTVAAISRPRRDIFPSPEPLSVQDRLLLRWVQEENPDLEQLLNKLPAADQVPGRIQVAELQIPALAVESIAIPTLKPDK